VSISPDGSFALVADRDNHLIRQIVLSTASVSTLAGVALSAGSTNGVGSNVRFNYPYGVSISSDGSFALVADTNNHLIRHIIISTATVSTLAGPALSSGSTNGVGSNALFYYPQGVSVSSDGSYALVADTNNHLIRHIILSTASVSTLAGVLSSGSTNGVGSNARFNAPYQVIVSSDGSYALVTDTNHLIRHIILSTASVSTLAGLAGSSGSTNGVGSNALFNIPYGVSISSDGSYALVADFGNHLIRHVILSTTTSVSTLAGVALSSGSTDGVGSNARFNHPVGLSISSDGSYALVADFDNHLIRKIILFDATRAPTTSPSVVPSSFPSSGIAAVTEGDVTTLAGSSTGFTDGVGSNVQFNHPVG
jgi:DNA-binding beta-propeller fold protein YncE